MAPDPDDRSGPGTGEPEPAPVDEFERIVAGWRREGAVPHWPDDERAVELLPEPDDPPAVPVAPLESAAVPLEDDHFVPPEPPPLPRLGPPAVVGLVLLGLGLVLVVSPTWVGVPSVYGLPLGLLCLAAGLGWLVLRLWPSPPPEGDGDGVDDGAVL